MPPRKTARKYEISHSIIIDKYRTNDRNKDEISILDHKNKSFTNLRITEEKVKGKLAKKNIRYTSHTRPEEIKAGSVVENSSDSKRCRLRNSFSSTETGITNKSLSTQSSIKSNQCGSSSDTTKKDIPTKTYRKNYNVSDDLGKKKRSGRKKLVSTSNKDSTSKMRNGSQKQTKVVSLNLRSEIVPGTVGENKTNGVNVFREQNRINIGNIKSSDNIVPSDLKLKMNPYVDMSKNQLDIQQVEVHRSQRIIKRNFKKTGNNEPFSTNCQVNCKRYPSRDKNQGTTPAALSDSEGKINVIPPKNVKKRQKIDSSNKTIFKSDVKQTKAALSYMKRSFNRTVTNARKRSDVDTESNSGIQQQQQYLNLSYADYISIAERILKRNGENVVT